MLPVLYCTVVVLFCFVLFCFVFAAAALVWPSCLPNPPADESEPFIVIPDGEIGITSMRDCAASDFMTTNVLAINPFLILLSGTLHFPFVFVRKTLFFFHAIKEIKIPTFF